MSSSATISGEEEHLVVVSHRPIRQLNKLVSSDSQLHYLARHILTKIKHKRTLNSLKLLMMLCSSAESLSDSLLQITCGPSRSKEAMVGESKETTGSPLSTGASGNGHAQ